MLTVLGASHKKMNKGQYASCPHEACSLAGGVAVRAARNSQCTRRLTCTESHGTM